MPTSTSSILDVLGAYDVLLFDDLEEAELPGIGRIEEGEAVYATSVVEIFGEGVELLDSGKFCTFVPP